MSETYEMIGEVEAVAEFTSFNERTIAKQAFPKAMELARARDYGSKMFKIELMELRTTFEMEWGQAAVKRVTYEVRAYLRT